MAKPNKKPSRAKTKAKEVANPESQALKELEQAQREHKLAKAIQKTQVIKARTQALRSLNKGLLNHFKGIEETPYYRPEFDRADINDTLTIEGEKLMQLSRHMEKNNSIAGAILTQFESGILGARGIIVEPAPVLKQTNPHEYAQASRIDSNLAQRLQDAWKEWSISPLINDEQADLLGVLRYLVRCWMRDGDVFIRVFRDMQANDLKLKIYTADQLAYSESSFIKSVERDKFGKVRYYYFKQNNYSSRLERVDAKQVIMLANRRDPNQFRGIPIYANVIPELNKINEYTQVEVVKAYVSATVYANIESESETAKETAPEVPEWLEYPSQMLNILEMPEGKKLTLNSPNVTNSYFENFTHTVLRLIASGVGLGFSTISNKYDGSYSALRHEQNITRPRIELYQSQLISVLRTIYRIFCEYYCLKWNVNFNNYENIYSADFHSYKAPSIDPLKDAKAKDSLLKNGLMSFSDLSSSEGRNFDDVVANHKRDKEVLEKAGLSEIYRNIFNVDANTVVSEGQEEKEDEEQEEGEE